MVMRTRPDAFLPAGARVGSPAGGVVPGAPMMPSEIPRHVARVTTLIFERRQMCLECIAHKARVSAEQARQSLETIAAAVKLYHEPACCRMCGESKPTYSVKRPQS